MIICGALTRLMSLAGLSRNFVVVVSSLRLSIRCHPGRSAFAIEAKPINKKLNDQRIFPSVSFLLCNDRLEKLAIVDAQGALEIGYCDNDEGRGTVDIASLELSREIHSNSFTSLRALSGILFICPSYFGCWDGSDSMGNVCLLP